MKRSRFPAQVGLGVAALALSACFDFGPYMAGPTTADASATCQPMACADLHKNCGLVSDGCGGMINCGTCAPLFSCGQDHVCACVAPMTMTCANNKCGKVIDNCGMTVDCGMGCPAGQTCGGNGANVCGTGPCTPKTCTGLGKKCGPSSDGCSATLNCGMCPSGQMCSSGACVCAPSDCPTQHKNCGTVSDGCTAMLNCGTCANGYMCGSDNVCFKQCVPATCVAGKSCGMLPDGCGKMIDCGNSCPGGQVCGAAMPNLCGTPMMGGCTPSGASPCDPVCNTGCPTGQRCDVGSATFMGRCISPGTGVTGQACTMGTGVDSCAPKYTCVVAGPTGEQCQKLCSKDSDCTGPDAGCCLGIQNGFNTCHPSAKCDPTSTGSSACGDGPCYFSPCGGDTSLTVCLFGSPGQMGPGGSCGNSLQCRPNLACTEKGMCEPVCKLGSGGCQTPKTCTAFVVGGTLMSSVYGVCR